MRFVVDETPYACWEWNLRDRNLEFLRGIDPTYYTYVADANAEHLDDIEHRQKAALAIRIAYSQALETLFALIGALVQAPNCAFGWLARYQNRELASLVRKLSYGQKVRTVLNFEPNWKNISRGVHGFLGHDDAKKEWIAAGFARAWGRFASEFLNEEISAEYNAAKHGLRSRIGGFTLSVGIEDTPGQLAQPEAMRSVGGSMFGTSFYTVEKLEDDVKTNFRARRLSRNWIPANLINGLHLLSMSIGNVVCALRIMNGEAPGKCLFHNPDRPEAFDAPWALSCGVNGMKMDVILTKSHIEPLSKQDILDSYDTPKDERAEHRHDEPQSDLDGEKGGVA